MSNHNHVVSNGRDTIETFATKYGVSADEIRRFVAIADRDNPVWWNVMGYLTQRGVKAAKDDMASLHSATMSAMEHRGRPAPAAAAMPAPEMAGASSLSPEQVRGLLAAAQRDAARAAGTAAPSPRGHVAGTPTEALVAVTPDPPGFNPYARDRAKDAAASWDAVLARLHGGKG